METPSDPRTVLAKALERHPERVESVPVQTLLMESARQNPKRPAYLKLAVPDEVAKTVRGGREGDLVLLVRVPRDVVERQESPIILPGDV